MTRAILRRLMPGLLLAAAVLAAPGPALRAAASSPPRIVAVGDVHGDADALAAILTRAGLIDAARHWSGGTATFVQTGDLLDRGSQVREVLDLMMALEGQAPSTGGRVVALLGNHEAMNATGMLRDVSPATFPRFADANSEARRASAFDALVKLTAKRRSALQAADSNFKIPDVYAEPQRDAWMSAHPPGWLEYRDAVGPDGAYGKWIRQHQAIVRLDDTVFLHGGLNPELAPKKLDDVAKRVRKELTRWDDMRKWMIDHDVALPSFTFDELVDAGRAELQRSIILARRDQPAPPDAIPPAIAAHPLADLLGLGDWFLVNASGPLWYRGFATDTSANGRRALDVLQNRYGPMRYVVGHTVMANGHIAARFQRRVFLIDTGLSSLYRAQGGQPSALEIEDGRFTAVYLNDRTVLMDDTR